MKTSIIISEKTINQAYIFSLILILILLPFSLRLSNLAIIILATFWILSGDFKQKFKEIQINWSKIRWLIFYFLILALSPLVSEGKTEGWVSLERHLSLLAFPLILATFKINSKQLNFILASFIISVLLVSVMGLIQTYTLYLSHQVNNSLLELNYYQWIFPQLINFHAPYLAIYLSTSGLITLLWCINAKKKFKLRLILIGLLIFFNLVLAFTASRTAIVANLFLVIAILTHLLIKNKQYLVLFLCFSFILLFSYYILDSLPYLKDKFLSGSGESERFYLWRAAFLAWKDAPIFGYGLCGASEKIHNSFVSLGYPITFSHNFDPHNQFIATALTAGLLGLISLLLMLIIPAYKALKKGHILLFAIILLFTGCFFTESVLFRQKGIVIFALLYSMMILHPIDSENE